MKQKSLIRLGEPQLSKVNQLLSKGQSVSLYSQVEVLELGDNSRAVIWIRHPKGGRARLGSCVLNPVQWAESLLCLEQGLRPVFEMSWQVLEDLGEGRFALLADEPPMQAYPPYLSEDLSELL